MKPLDPDLITPIYAKTHPRMTWPDDQPVFYMLAANGLFLCRNHRFFRSCTPARRGPAELAIQQAFLDSRYPKIPQALMEMAVGFFSQVKDKYGCEAALLLGWDRHAEEVHLFVPKQRCTMYQTHYAEFPVGVHYEVPAGLPEGLGMFGDIHSHVDGAAYASATDQRDERHRPGLHVVVGRIGEEPPEFYVEATVDGARFKLHPAQVFEGYRRRAEVAQHCLDQVQVEYLTRPQHGWGSGWSGDPAVNVHKPASCAQGGIPSGKDGENDADVS